MASAGVALGTAVDALHFITPKSESQVTNLDVLRIELKNYYGTPGVASGTGATAGWTLALNQDSNYAAEARSVAADGGAWLASKAGKAPMQAIVFDVDDTTLTTWNYELFSNWDFNPTTNGIFVGLTSGAFTGNLFPATPGMLDLAWTAHEEGYAVFFITGRGDSQHNATLANLIDDSAGGFADITTVDHTLTGLSVDMPEIDAGYPAPTPVDIGHGSFTDGLFTKPPVGSYPSYLNTADFCATFIAQSKSCPTIQYKSGTRAYIESLGYDIVANFGDQFSDLLGGFADKTFKMPNPNYYLP
ncbi:MAG: acid phosphatase [Chloroflexi bacterium]|nr:acid phosphatase [Chloroflexota bacterium]